MLKLSKRPLLVHQLVINNKLEQVCASMTRAGGTHCCVYTVRFSECLLLKRFIPVFLSTQGCCGFVPGKYGYKMLCVSDSLWTLNHCSHIIIAYNHYSQLFSAHGGAALLVNLHTELRSTGGLQAFLRTDQFCSFSTPFSLQLENKRLCSFLFLPLTGYY